MSGFPAPNTPDPMNQLINTPDFLGVGQGALGAELGPARSAKGITFTFSR